MYTQIRSFHGLFQRHLKHENKVLLKKITTTAAKRSIMQNYD